MKKTGILGNAFRTGTLAGAVALILVSANVSNATVINKTFEQSDDCGLPSSKVCGTSGGIITFTSGEAGVTSSQLKITFDNTTVAGDVGSTYLNSSIITGLFVHITENITSATVASFVDGDGNDITGWAFDFVPGASQGVSFEIGFETVNGANRGIYNDANSALNINTDVAVPDTATLILNIGVPTSWAFTTVDNATLRMQRVGTGGEGSLKIVTSSSSTSTSGSTGPGATSSTGPGATSNGNVSEPGVLGLLGLGLLGQAYILRQRRRRQV